MSIVFACGMPRLPQLITGLEINTNEFALTSIEAGHTVVVVAKLSVRDAFRLRRTLSIALRGRSAAGDESLAYPPPDIPPIFRAERYATETVRREVVFVNPIPLKGLDIALAVAARCPDIPFRFVKAWSLVRWNQAGLRSRLRTMPNVTLNESTAEMRPVHGRARIVLMPSQCDETWGRVASEAHLSGLPVVAKDRGGWPESVALAGSSSGATSLRTRGSPPCGGCETIRLPLTPCRRRHSHIRGARRSIPSGRRMPSSITLILLQGGRGPRRSAEPRGEVCVPSRPLSLVPGE